ncbi:MAG: nucleotidyltransferase domain-containing protein [Nannocystis sp.]|nr:nucleotidyltransferase domain-containing protein [Nannocystis sp.]
MTQEARRAAGAPLVAALRASLPAALQALRERYGVDRVMLFGSFARGTPTEWSDVDLVVEGLPASEHFRAMVLLEGVLGRTVDLVRAEDLDERRRCGLFEEAIGL